jgi:biopolymer transport protein ExbD
MKQILEFLKDPKKQRLLLLVGIFVLSIFLFKDCGRTKTDNEVTQLKQNIEAYKDSLTVSKNKAKEIQYNNGVLAATNNNLNELNKDLANEVDKQKGKVIFLTKSNASLVDSINKLKNGNITVKVNGDGSQDIAWHFDTLYAAGNGHYIKGNIHVLPLTHDTTIMIKTKTGNVALTIPKITSDDVEVSIPKDSIAFTLITGLERDKESNSLKIFVRSPYPGFSVTKLEGAIIDPQKDPLIKSYFPRKRFVIGPQIGAGLTGDLKLRLFIGLGVTYKIFEF